MKRAAAFFDVDGTLLPGMHSERVFFQHLLARRALSPRDLFSTVGLLLMRATRRWRQVVRSDRGYLRGKQQSWIQELAQECFERRLIPAIPQRAVEQAEVHRKRGELVILVSGSLDLLLEHLSRYLGAQAFRGTSLEVVGEHFTGRLNGIPPWGEEKVTVARQLAQAYAIDLRCSFAYGNDISDAHLLQAVGHPVAVNPSRQLRRLAREQGWEIMGF